MKKISGLGQCSLDYIAYTDGFPEEDAKKEIQQWYIEGGGPVATALVSLSRLGMECSFMGLVSDDRAGRDIRGGLKAEGINTRGLRTKKGGSSQTAFIIVNARCGSRTILWKRPTVEPLTRREVRRKTIQESEMLMLDGLSLDASIEAARVAKKANVPVMLDAGSLRDGTMELAAQSDFVVCAENFARAIAKSPRAALKELARLKPRTATVTLGKKGSITWYEGEIFSTPAFKVKAIDTTGAGDVFHGGYAYAVLQGWNIKKTLDFASAFAALKCTAQGGRSGIPSLQTTLSFIKKNGR